MYIRTIMQNVIEKVKMIDILPYGQKLSVKKKPESHKRIPQMGNYFGVNGVRWM